MEPLIPREDGALTPKEMSDFGALPMCFIGTYYVDAFPCMHIDDSNEYEFKRQDMCGRKSYASYRIETPTGLVWVALCKHHWAHEVRREYGKSTDCTCGHTAWEHYDQKTRQYTDCKICPCYKLKGVMKQ